MSTPLVVVLRGNNVRSSSFVEKSSKAIRMKTNSCAALLLSTDSSHWMLKKLHLSGSLSSWYAKLLDITDSCLAIVDAPSWTSDRVEIRSVRVSHLRVQCSNYHHYFLEDFSVCEVWDGSKVKTFFFFVENTRFWWWKFIQVSSVAQSNLLGSQSCSQIVVFSDFGSLKKIWETLPYSAFQWVVSIVAFMTRSEVSLHIVPLRRRHSRPENHTQLPFTAVKKNSSSHSL